MRRLALFGAGLLAAWATGPIRAADEFRVTASVYPLGRITDTTEIRLVLSIEGSSMPEVSSLNLPPMKNLHVISGPANSRQSQMSWVNGAISSSNSLSMTYGLAAEGPGPAEIPAFDVQVGGTHYRTSPLRFTVEAGGGAPPPGAQGHGARGRAPQPQSGDDGIDVFLETHAGAATAWVGQPVLVETTLYTSVATPHFDWIDDPTFKGAWTESLAVDSNREAARVEKGGRQYMAFPVSRKVVVPTAPGAIAIPQATALVQVQRPSRDRFGMLFGLEPLVNLQRKTSPLTITARPLPEAGKPPDFDGTVGSYRISATADRKQAEVGDAIALRVTVEGLGSLQAAKPPRLPSIPDAKFYDPKIVENASTGANHLSSRKTWEWVVVPLSPGSLDLPAASFSYFDTESGTYREARADLPTVAVVRGAAVPDTGVARGEVQQNLRDIAFVKPRSGPLREPVPPLSRRAWFLALLVLPVAAVPVGIWAGRRRERLLTDSGFARGDEAPRACGTASGGCRGLPRGDRRQPRGLRGRPREPIGRRPQVRRARRDPGGGRRAPGVAEPLPSLPGDVRFRALHPRRRAGRRARGRLAGGPRDPEGARGVLVSRTRLATLALALLACAGGIGAPPARAETPEDVFDRGCKAYGEGKWDEAAEDFRAVLRYGFADWRLEYNLANAELKRGKLGPAILHYERARRLAPADRDIAGNLAIARSRSRDVVEDPSDSGPVAAVRGLQDRVGPGGQAALVLVGVWVLAAIVTWCGSHRGGFTAGWTWTLCAVVAATALLFLSWRATDDRLVGTPRAVVLKPSVDALAGPGMNNASLFTLHEGTTVEIEAEREGWLQVALPNGLTGWVARDDAERI